MSSINSHLQRLNERIAQLNDRPSALVRDMVLEELRQCYDAVLNLSLAMQEAPVQAPRPRAVVSMYEPPVEETPAAKEQPEARPTLAETPTPTPPASEPVVLALAPTPLAPEQPAEEQPAPVRSRFMVSVSETPDAPAPATPPKADLTGSELKTERPNDSAILAGRLNAKPITDLQSGIPLNEKFGLIRNLFAGNASDFGDAVLKLNNSRSADELKHYFQLLGQRRNWDVESESYRVLQSYVERKASTLTPSDTDSDH